MSTDKADKYEDPKYTSEDARKLAEAVRRIDKFSKEFTASGMNRRALVVLLHDATSVTKRDINAVLDGLDGLGDMYLERSTKKGTP
jgi:hypothetical protein